MIASNVLTLGVEEIIPDHAGHVGGLHLEQHREGLAGTWNIRVRPGQKNKLYIGLDDKHPITRSGGSLAI